MNEILDLNRKKGIVCSVCRMRLFSWHRHDFRSCWCSSIYIDGGDDYTKVGWTSDTRPPKSISLEQDDLDLVPRWYLEKLARSLSIRQQDYLYNLINEGDNRDE